MKYIMIDNLDSYYTSVFESDTLEAVLELMQKPGRDIKKIHVYEISKEIKFATQPSIILFEEK